MFAEYSLNVRYIRCLDPNIKRTYEFFCLSPGTFSECSVKVSIQGGFTKSGKVPRMFEECIQI